MPGTRFLSKAGLDGTPPAEPSARQFGVGTIPIGVGCPGGIFPLPRTSKSIFMKRTRIRRVTVRRVTVSTVWVGLLCLLSPCISAQAGGSPKIQFDRTVYDFGKTSQVSVVSGVFKFKNVGDDVLKLETPKPTCGCTVAAFKSDTLEPGASGELPFTLSLGPHRAKMEKHISVRSNDPLTPEVSLTLKVDYTPLYELSPITLAPLLAFGVDELEQISTLTRTDGKPMQVNRLDTSKPWITAKLEPAVKGEQGVARIRITLRRNGPPRRFNEFVQVYADGVTNTPASSIYIYGQLAGEVLVLPEAFYWSFTGDANKPLPGLDESLARRVTIRSVTGKPLDLKNARSTIKGVKLELEPKESGKVYELVARLDEVPAGTQSGIVSFETSVAAQSTIELPIVVNVFKQ